MIDRLPPHSEPAERGFVGCCLQYPGAFDAADGVGFRPEWLYHDNLRTVYLAARAIADARGDVAPDTVAQRLVTHGMLDQVGGTQLIFDLVNEAFSESRAVHWLKELQPLFQCRELLKVITDTGDRVGDTTGNDDVAALIGETAERIHSIGESTIGTDTDGATLAKLAGDSILNRLGGGKRGLPTGLMRIDNRLSGGGMNPGQVIVIGGRPGTGKTALAVNIALNVTTSGTPVGFVSLEMSAIELGERLLSIMSGVNVQELSSTTRDPAIPGKIKAAKDKLKVLPMVIDETPARTIASIRALARRWKRRNGIGLLIVDYLQLIEGGSKARDRREAMDGVSRGLKVIAKELNIPVIALAQLNREIDKEEGRIPRMTDLRESGGIEQDADIIGLLYRPPTEEGATPPDEDQPAEVRLRIAKQRGGMAGIDAKLEFTPTLTKFTDYHTPIDHHAL